MKRILLSSLAAVPALLLAALLVPAGAAAAGPVSTASSCSGTTTVTCNLWAEPGTLPLPGSSVPAWGFATTAGGSPSIPGPAIVVDQGATVTVNLVNDLPQATSLVFEGVATAPDLTSVAASGGTHPYTFTATAPGTYLYEAGILPGSEYQVSMGLYGVLIVRPTAGAGQAYAGAETAFGDEALVVVSEIDPALNGSASPQAFDLRTFAPRYFLVNGVAYTSAGAASIPVTSGNTLLLRYANAGNLHHSIGVLGLHQRVLAADGSQLPAQRTMVAETIAPGQTADVLVTLPATTAASTLYPIYDASLLLNNSTASGIGGMLALLDASGTATGTDTVGPVTSGVSFSPSTGALAATVSDASTGNATVSAAEYFIDTPGTGGSGVALTGAFASPTEAVTATVTAPEIAGLSSGTHTIYVHGRDALGNWGTFGSTTFVIDLVGPTTSALTLTPGVTNGTASVALAGSASDVATGNSNVTAAEYTIDGTGTTAMTLNKVVPTVSLTATIPASAVNALTEGAHTVAVRSQDAAGNWGAAVSISLTVDKTGPATSSVAANPPSSNGTTGQSSSNPTIRVTASVSDAASGNLKVAGAEGFIDTIGANGSGFAFVAVDGVFSSATEAVYVDIPLSTINLLSSGNHAIHVHGKDAVGNWGSTSSGTLVIDKAAPTVSGVTLAPPAANAQAVTVTASATDVATGNSTIAGGELFIDTAGAAGTGTAMTAGAASPSTTISGSITAARVAALTAGPHTVYVRARDAAGNWGATASAVLLIDRTAPTISNVTVSPSPTVGAASVTAVVTAADNAGGSGLNGGDYWIDGTTTPPAGRIAFAGTSSPITVAGINVAALTAGSHNLRVRVKDAAGNFSPVFTRSFTVSLARPTVIKAFAGAVRGGLGSVVQRTTTLTITLANSNATAATGAALTDNLPQPAAGTLTVVTSATTCGGTTSTANSSRRLLLNGGTIPAGGSCTVTATVRMSAAATNGPYTLTNTILAGGLTTSNAGSNQVAASAVLTVNP